MKITHVKRIAGYSTNGNPRYEVNFGDGIVLRTAVDSSVAYEINNPEYRNVEVKITTNRRGHIIGIRRVES